MRYGVRKLTHSLPHCVLLTLRSLKDKGVPRVRTKFRLFTHFRHYELPRSDVLSYVVKRLNPYSQTLTVTLADVETVCVGLHPLPKKSLVLRVCFGPSILVVST